MTLTLQGRINSFKDGIYRCVIYPTGPVILAADIIGALAKGTVTGTLSIDGNPDAHWFSLLVVRQQQE